MIVDSATIVVNLLATQIERRGGVAGISVEYHTAKFGRSVISKLCFGSNHSLGEEIFSKFRVLVDVTSTKAGTINAIFPILRYLPTNRNRESWRLEKEIKASILKLVKEREQVVTENDILQLIIEGAINKGLNQSAADPFVTDNCKNIYIAGLDTFSSTSIMWALMLLAINPAWQGRVRSELTMVIYESMRLYPPGPFLAREALADFRFGGIYVPKGLGFDVSFKDLQGLPHSFRGNNNVVRTWGLVIMIGITSHGGVTLVDDHGVDAPVITEEGYVLQAPLHVGEPSSGECNHRGIIRVVHVITFKRGFTITSFSKLLSVKVPFVWPETIGEHL
ncbi:hypothetical protein FNV43_RR15058 [Rhamnella rubrinervis]|uniref:Cytochrome P450 n=1 Tax=Rhamnella rubrinervis TaxID=2594499 RepID=A0A8K0GTV6_9ROSA|nr:hypothetical protein FNV43_RR15058 [Rhamnella rubrinervis]